MKRLLPMLIAITAPQALAQAQPPAMPAPPVPAAAAPAPVEQEPAASEENAVQLEAVTVKDYRSVMFSPDAIEAMQPLIEAFKTGKVLPKTPAKSLQQATPVSSPKIYTYPQFFLESLVYYPGGKWTLWINGGRFTQDAPKADTLEIQSVSQKEAVILWRPAANERLKWSPAQDGRVILDAAEHTIRFTLQPNQTFSSYSMRVLEGKVQPAEVDITVPGVSAKPSISSLPSPVSGPPNRPGPGGEATGLESLINRYQNYNPKE